MIGPAPPRSMALHMGLESVVENAPPTGSEDLLHIVSPVSGGIVVDHSLPAGIVETSCLKSGKDAAILCRKFPGVMDLYDKRLISKRCYMAFWKRCRTRTGILHEHSGSGMLSGGEPLMSEID